MVVDSSSGQLINARLYTSQNPACNRTMPWEGYHRVARGATPASTQRRSTPRARPSSGRRTRGGRSSRAPASTPKDRYQRRNYAEASPALDSTHPRFGLQDLNRAQSLAEARGDSFDIVRRNHPSFEVRIPVAVSSDGSSATSSDEDPAPARRVRFDDETPKKRRGSAVSEPKKAWQQGPGGAVPHDGTMAEFRNVVPSSRAAWLFQPTPTRTATDLVPAEKGPSLSHGTALRRRAHAEETASVPVKVKRRRPVKSAGSQPVVPRLHPVTPQDSMSASVTLAALLRRAQPDAMELARQVQTAVGGAVAARPARQGERAQASASASGVGEGVHAYYFPRGGGGQGESRDAAPGEGEGNARRESNGTAGMEDERNRYLAVENARLRALLESTTLRMVDVLTVGHDRAAQG